MVRMSAWNKGMSLAVVVMLIAATVGQAQQRRRSGLSSFGFSRTVSKTLLLRSDKVRKLLSISDDQKSKIDAVIEASRKKSREMYSGLRNLSREERTAKYKELRAKRKVLSDETNKKLTGILTPAQSKRLAGIVLQMQGTDALSTDDVAKALNLDDKQKQKIRDLMATRRDMQTKLYTGLRDLPRDKRREKYAELRKKGTELRTETEKAILEVLTAAQREQYAALKGAKIDIDRRSLYRGLFRRGGSGGAAKSKRRPAAEK